MNLRAELEYRISSALAACGAEGAAALVGIASRPEFGDYQANGCMAAGKKIGTNPRQLAERVVEKLDLADIAKKVEVAGPGFLNITLSEDFLARQLSAAESDERLGTTVPERPQTVVVDYSSPNLAKEMHVGHLRSTIIGDAIARVLEFLGHRVIRQNHVGDWGTQFGMLVEYIFDMDRRHGRRIGEQENGTVVSASLDEDKFRVSDLEVFYREAKQRFDSDPDFAERARQRVVKLQSGDKKTIDIWEKFRAESLRHCQEVYEKLGVKLTPENVRGESFYNDQLPELVEALGEKGLLSESEGALCVFLDEFTGKDGEPLPVIVRKSDGGYLYATTDLAAIRYRTGELQAHRVLYVTDSRQDLHFRQVFAVARKAGFAPESVSLEHVPFGMMLGEDGRPFKTREGGTVKLKDLMDQAVEIAAGIFMDEHPDIYGEARPEEVYQAVGIGAMKYADLAQNRLSDYVFSWDKMLSLEGNTAPYMQYAYARVRSIYRKGEVDETKVRGAAMSVAEPAERTLAVKLLQFPETIQAVADTAQPHLLCAYLYELAGAFMGFYENCPVLKAVGDLRLSRLGLCDLTSRVIATGLGLLGIKTLEKM